MNKTKVAIVILNWNGEKLLPQFLPSVIKHSQLDSVEIIVADNGSTDQSLSLLQKKFPTIKTINLKQNYGFARGYNETLKQIEAEYYVVLNSDVEVSPDWLHTPIKMMDEDRKIAVIQPKILSYNEPTCFEYAGAAGGFIDKYGYPLCRGRVLNVIEEDKGQYDSCSNILWASGACMFVRADLFHKAGGFDSDFWAHMEEIDLCWRLKSMGYHVLFTPESEVYHLGGGSLPYNSPKKLFLNFRNSLWMLFKNLPKRYLPRILVVRMLLDGVAAVKLLTEFNFNGIKSVVKAHYQFYKSLPSIRKKRQAISVIGAFKKHPEMLSKSIVCQFYFRKKKKFSEYV